jgi:signal peptidase I
VKPAAEAKPRAAARGWLDDLPTLVFAIAIALGIRAFLFQSFYVPSDSMLPTLLVGDHVFVNKFVYGPRIPFTEWRLPGLREPRRGEVVVLRLARDASGRIYPADLRPDLPTENFIKRLVGLPGDRIEVREGVLYLNGEAVAPRATGDTYRDVSGRVFDVQEETVAECRHRVLDDPRVPPMDLPPTRIEAGRYLFLGDNRDNSYDSRRWGTVRLAEVEGPAGLLYWSWDWNGSWLSLLNPWTWFQNLTKRTRWDRMGDFVGCDGP